MIVNPDKFQAILIDGNNTNDLNHHILKFNEYEITSKNSVVLLGIEIDNKLNFENHTHGLQGNFLISKQRFLSQQAKKIFNESFFMANFNYCPLVWLFCNKKLKLKQEQIKKGHLAFYTMTMNQTMNIY